MSVRLRVFCWGGGLLVLFLAFVLVTDGGLGGADVYVHPQKTRQEYLEKQWTEGLSEEEAIKLTVKTLLEVVDSGSKNMEVRNNFCICYHTDSCIYMYA